MATEGWRVQRPPFFDGTDYNYWSMRMEAFLESSEFGIWDIIENQYKSPWKKTQGEVSSEAKRWMEYQWKERKLTQPQGKKCAILCTKHSWIKSSLKLQDSIWY